MAAASSGGAAESAFIAALATQQQLAWGIIGVAGCSLSPCPQHDGAFAAGGNSAAPTLQQNPGGSANAVAVIKATSFAATALIARSTQLGTKEFGPRRTS